ncbi:MAG: hypothetical protein UIM53_07250 [Acutalibacteraceae bacterium]|nr:hypothetical protein [Acutalibacteraceae bacterium]
MYKTEHEFSKSLSDRLTKAGLMVTRIESHNTGNGIPDMFVCGRGLDTWLELKNDPKLFIKDKAIKVAWRPGQVAWMYTYFQKHRTKSCLTLVAASDGIFIIPMTATFKDHTVYNPQSISYEDFRWINIWRVLEAMSVYWIKDSDENYLDMINSFVDEFYPCIDYDPECLFNPDLLDKTADIEVFNDNKLDIIMTLEATIHNNS